VKNACEYDCFKIFTISKGERKLYYFQHKIVFKENDKTKLMTKELLNENNNQEILPINIQHFIWREALKHNQLIMMRWNY